MGIPFFALGAAHGGAIFLIFSLYLVIVVIFLTLFWMISASLAQIAKHLGEIVQEMRKRSGDK
jgi:hypothetical protein